MEQIEGIYDLCVFKGCPNEVQMWGKALFPFPQSTDPIFEIWLENCGNKSIIGRSEPALRKLGLCSDHFTPDSFYDEDRRKLRRDAVPEPYSPTFKRSYPLTRANTRINDHNYALVSNETSMISYKSRFHPLRKYIAINCSVPSSNTTGNNQGNARVETASGNPKPKRGRPLCRIYGRRSPTVCKNNEETPKASSSIETEDISNSTRLESTSRLAAGSTTTGLSAASSSIENISGNRRGRRAAGGGNKPQGSSLQIRGSGLTDGEVGILQKTNDELKKQNTLLRKLNGQLKLKMKKCEARNSMLKIMLEKVSSIDGFLDLHRCLNNDVRNLIKEKIDKCEIPPGGD